MGRGPSASIDIAIQPDLQPHMDNFVEGVWATYRSTPEEEALVAGARRIHLVLVEGAIRELDRLHAAGLTDVAQVTADFLGFRHYTVERFAETMRAVDVGFVGWPGALDDPVVSGIRDVAHGLGRLVVVTLGSRGVQVFDGRPGGKDQFVPVVPRHGPRDHGRLRRRVRRRLPGGMAPLPRRARCGRGGQGGGRGRHHLAASPA